MKEVVKGTSLIFETGRYVFMVSSLFLRAIHFACKPHQFILQFLRGKTEQAKLFLAMHAHFFRLKVLRDERWSFPTYLKYVIPSKTGHNMRGLQCHCHMPPKNNA